MCRLSNQPSSAKSAVSREYGYDSRPSLVTLNTLDDRHIEKPMPDLYAINIYLQQRLEQDWREEVRALEAAQWLHAAGLLTDRKGGLPLRNLLREGRIAGQEQRPNEKNGSWFIRRLAASRDPHAIQQARDRLRRYLPIERSMFADDWPVNQGASVFWQELGKTVATFGYLEHILAKTCYVVLATSERAADLSDADDEAVSRWYKRLMRSQTDSLRGLTDELGRVLAEDGRVPHAVREDLVKRLEELRPWRNALCHGAWLDFANGSNSGTLYYLYRHDGVPTPFPPVISLMDLLEIRARTTDITFRAAEAASVAGAGFALAAAMPRQYQPRNTPPGRG